MIETAVTTSEIIDFLKAKYSVSVGEWVHFDEMRCGTGFKKDAERRIDFFALNCWSNHRRVAYEVKISRSDFLREIKDPRKRRMALLFSNEFYFIAPKGLIKISELPPECGLVEVSRNDDGSLDSHTLVSAPARDTLPPSWNFFAALVRRLQKEQTA